MVDSKNYKFSIRNPIKQNRIKPEYLKLARDLKCIVDKHGAIVFEDEKHFFDIAYMQNPNMFKGEHIMMIKAIIPQIKLLYNENRFTDDETVVEQMYCVLLKNGISRNVIIGLLYAVFFSLGKTLKLSQTETKQLKGCDLFVYQQDRDIKVNDGNIEGIENLVKQSDNSAIVELGHQILEGNIKKYRYRITFANDLCEEGLNHGSGKAAQVLGDDKLMRAKQRLISNDDYSRAYEYYTTYGSMLDTTSSAKKRTGIVDILNLGIYNKKMVLNYIVSAVIFSLSLFIPIILREFGIQMDFLLSKSACMILSSLEFATVFLYAIIRHLRPFFTTTWVVFLQTLIWFIGLIIMLS